jgi:tripartite ATP-independent transporter DctM subunit
MTAGLQIAIILIVFLLLLMSGHPLAFSLGGLSVIFGFLYWDNPGVLNMFVTTCNSLVMNPTYVSAPLFLLMGSLLEKSGVADDLFDSMYIVMGRIKGGLAITAIIICTLLAAATGVIAAAISMMAMLALPAMMKNKYDFKLSAGTIMAAGCLGQLIPPSVVMIVYGSQAQLSIGKLFAGGIGAGLMFSVMFIIYIVIRTVINPNIAPTVSKEISDKYSTKQKVLMILKSILPTIVLIVAVLGSILMGVATPTEAAGVGVVGALALVIVNKKFNWRMLIDAFYSTTKSSAMIFYIVLAASMFTYVFMGLGGGQLISGILTGLPFSRWIILSIILATIFIMGMFLDSYGIVMISVPIFTPIITALQFDPLWFGVLFVVMMLISYMSPPFAYAAFYVKGAAREKIDLGELYIATWPYLLIYFLGVIILCIFPQIITYLPSIMMK